MKIILCHERFVFRYGVDRVLLALAREFRQRGHHVTLLGLSFDEAAGSAACADRVVRVPPPTDTLEADVAVAEWIANHWEEHFAGSNRPDVVVDAGWPFFSAIPIFEGHGCRVVFQDHGIIPKDGMPEIGWRTLHLVEELKRAFVRRASAIVAVSAFIRDTQSRAAAEAGQPLLVIPNGIDHLTVPDLRETPADAEAAIASFGVSPGNSPRILCTGRFEPGLYKQSELVFALEQRVRAWAPEAWIGTLATRDALDAAAGHGNHSRAVPLGQPDDVTLARLVRASDVVVCFSRWEGFNLPLAEAQMLGRPCLVFDLAAHPEVVAHPWQLCADVDAVATKVRELVDGSAPAGIRDGSALRAWSSSPEWTWSAIADRYLELVGKITESDRTPVRGSAHRPSVLIDVTNAVRDPSNSGCVRVARRLAAEWQAYLNPIFAVWMREEQVFRFPTSAEFQQLSAFRGPARPADHPQSADSAPVYVEPWLVEATDACAFRRPEWLILPEIRHRPDLWPILEFAARTQLRTASIFHDAIPLVRPELVPDPAYREGHADYMRGLSRVDACVANSRASAEALREFWRTEGLSGRVVSCLLPGGLPGERPAAGRSGGVGVSEEPPFVLMVSTLEPRKGHRRLIEAFLAARVRARRPDWRLVLVGGRLWWSNEIAEFVEQSARTHPPLTWLEDAPDDRLEHLYRTCAFTVYASEIEGFGLPIMESMWHGRPCLCHADGVMRELAAEGGCATADLLDPAAFEAALLRLMDDEAMRGRLAFESRARSVKRWCDFAAEFWARLAWVRWSALESPGRGAAEDERAATPIPGRLSFIVPTYNRLDLLQVCLGTLRETLPAGLDAEIVVVDDASGDGTRTWLERGEGSAAGLRVVRHATNRGYGSAVNHAARIATGEWLVLLNHDLSFRAGWLEPMLDIARRRPGVFAVGNLQCSARDGSVDHAGIVFDPTGHPEHFRADLAWIQRRPEREFPAITFACALVERARFLALGGLDSRFLNGFEDVDLCLRARQHGWPCVVANASVVDHQISATPGRKLAEAENRHRFFVRWQPIAVVLGRDWEERLAWERSGGFGVPDDRRPPGPFRVLVDLTSLAASDVAQAARRVWAALARSPTGEAGSRFAPVFVGRLEHVSSTVSDFPTTLTGACAAPEVWAFDERGTSEVDVPARCRVVSGPAITVARRLQADVVVVPMGRSDLVSPDIPTVTADSFLVQSGVAEAARPCPPPRPDLAARVDGVVREYAAHGVTWRWADAVSRDASGGASGREASLTVSQVSPDQILCCIDEPVRWGEPVPLIEIRGWCVHRDSLPLTGIAVRTAAGRTWCGVMGRARPDVAAAFPGIATAGASGFSVRVPASAGPFELWAIGADFSVRLRTWAQTA